MWMNWLFWTVNKSLWTRCFCRVHKKALMPIRYCGSLNADFGVDKFGFLKSSD